MPYQSFLGKGGEMGALIRKYSWSETSLGLPENWSQSLLTSVNMMLTSRFPMLIFWGKELITFYNDAFRPSLGNDGKHPSSLGQPGHISWAESWPVIGPMIHDIMNGGDAVWFEDQKLPIYREGKMGYAYWTYSFSPLMDDNGTIGGLLVTCSETTKSVESVIRLEQSESRFQNLVREATVGIIVLTGEELVSEIVNDAYAILIGHTASDIYNRPIFDIIPEAEAYFRPIIEKVRTTGEHLLLTNTPYSLLDNHGDKKEGFLNLVYQPYREKDGSVNGVIILCQDVTESVRATEKLDEQYKKEQQLNEEFAVINEELISSNEELLAIQAEVLAANAKLGDSEEKLRLTIESSNLGTCYLNMVTGQFRASERMKQLYGFRPDEEMNMDDAVRLITDDYREMIQSAINDSLISHQFYEVEYPITGYHDGMVRWIKATGKLFDNDKTSSAEFFGTVEDITERKRDEQRKNDFIGMVSHEMKTPLTSMAGYLELLQMDAGKHENRFAQTMSGKARKQVDRMTTMINGFLNVSRLESGKLTIEKTRFDLALLLKDTEEEMLSLYVTHRVIFYPVSAAFIEADKEKIASVMSNLISNAVKYSAPGSAIEVACETANGMAKISVKDEGVGIPQEELPKLFERYYRVDNVNTKSIAGFGIGLYLCCEIVHRHDGEIWAESEEGKGSAFYFTLPVVEV